MNRTTPIVLLALLVLAGGWVVFFQMPADERARADARQKERENYVFDVDRSDKTADGISALAIVRPTGTLVFERIDRMSWRMTQPLRAAARADILNGLAASLLFMNKLDTDITADKVPTGGLASYGLDPPKIVVTIATGEGDARVEHVLHLGDTDGTRRYVYARRPDRDDVMLVHGRLLAGTLLRPASVFRDTRFMRFNQKTVTAFSVASPRTPRIDFVRKGATWHVTHPYRDRAQPIRVLKLLDTIQGIEARSFHAEKVDDLRALGLAPPRLRVAFTRNDGTKAALLIGADADDPVGTVYAKLEKEPAVYTIADVVVEPLSFEATALRSRQLDWLSAPRVSELRIEGRGRRLLMRRNARTGGWRLLAPVQMPADRERVEGLIRGIAAQEVIRFPNETPDAATLAEYGLDPSSAVVVTVKSTDRPTRVYTFGKIDPTYKDLYVRRSGGDAVYTVYPELRISGLPTFHAMVTGSYLTYRTRQVASIPKPLMSELMVRRPTGTFKLARLDETHWRMTRPVQAPGDVVNVGGVVALLEGLQAHTFIAEKAEPGVDYGFDKPTYEVRVGLRGTPAGPPTTHTLIVGKALGEIGYAAKLDDEDLVFTVSGALIEAINRELRDRTVWRFEARDTTGLRWENSGERAVLRVVKGRWILIEPRGRRINVPRAGNILHNLSNLRVERFETYTERDLARCGLDKPRAKVTLTVAGIDHTVFIGKPMGPYRVYAMTDDVEGVFTVPKSLADAILGGPLSAPDEPAPAR